jgi:1,4-dihydroxy-2-naphthoyl-CoA hydrolase
MGALPGSRTSVTDAAALNRHPLPLARLMGIEFREAGHERVVAEIVVRQDLCTTGERAHGGALMALADTTAAMGTAISLPDNATGTTTIESKTNFVGAATLGTRLIAIATPIHRGRQTQVWQTRIETDRGKLVAVVSQTQMVLYPTP